jgi:glycosyltransferase involved in cell wall biosynthesis
MSPSIAARRILMIAPFLWSGAGKTIVRMLQDLQKSGLECEIISSGKSRGLSDWPEYVRSIKKCGIPHHIIDFFDRNSSCIWQSVERLKNLLETRRYDLIHVHSGVPAFAATICRDFLNLDTPIVATFHSWDPGRPSWMNTADIWALNRCDQVYTVSHSYKKELESWGLSPDRSSTICFGVDLPALKKHAPSKQFRVLSVGRIEPRKDQATLLHAFSILHRQFPNTELCLAGPAGDPEYAEQLRRKAKQYGWNQGVRFLGKVSDPNHWYSISDIFVSTSRDEGLGLSLLEAMAHGLPAVCTEVNGHIEFAKNRKNALLFPTGSHRLLAHSLKELYLNASLRNSLGENAHLTVARSFTWNQAMENYRDVYRFLIAESQNTQRPSKQRS